VLARRYRRQSKYGKKKDCSQNVIFLTFGRDRALYPSIGIKT
jgi:hypothetical protein